jgi:hypothetical protein
MSRRSCSRPALRHRDEREQLVGHEPFPASALLEPSHRGIEALLVDRVERNAHHARDVGGALSVAMPMELADGARRGNMAAARTEGATHEPGMHVLGEDRPVKRTCLGREPGDQALELLVAGAIPRGTHEWEVLAGRALVADAGEDVGVVLEKEADPLSPRHRSR